jgi:hypothetical protein
MHTKNRLHQFCRVGDAAAIGGLAFIALYYLTAFHFGNLFSNPARQVDFGIWRFVPNFIFEHGRYPAAATGDWEHALFPYLPSAAAIMRPLSWPPEPIAFALWLAIEAAAFALSIWAALHLSGARTPGRWLIGLVAVLLCENAVGWDFRNHNNNIVYLAMVMLGLLARRTWLAALLFAVSINFKLYSGVLPIAFGCRREMRLALATALGAVLIAVALPAAVFGLRGALQLAADWMSQINYTLSPAQQASSTVSLVGSVAALLAVQPGAVSAAVALRALQAGWLALAALYFFSCARAGAGEGERFHQFRLADVCVALMVPLPLSTWLIPYHAIVLLPAYTLLLTIAASAGWSGRARLFAATACVGTQIVHFAVPAWSYRGLAYLVTFAILVAGLAVVRLERRRSDRPADRPQTAGALPAKNAV